MVDIQSLILAFGYLGIFTVIFAESGFLLGIFLPGDSLLFTAGLLASHGYFNILFLLILAITGAILGDNFGYYCGKKFGRKIFTKEHSILFNKKYVNKTAEFYNRHGKKAIILARFLPIIRTIAPIFAGVGDMHYKTFVSYNIIGGFLWAGTFLLASYWLGGIFPKAQDYLTLILLGIIAFSVIPVVIEFFRKSK